MKTCTVNDNAQDDQSLKQDIAEVDLETKARMLAACGSFTSRRAPSGRWRDDPPLMQFLRSL